MHEHSLKYDVMMMMCVPYRTVPYITDLHLEAADAAAGADEDESV